MFAGVLLSFYWSRTVRLHERAFSMLRSVLGALAAAAVMLVSGQASAQTAWIATVTSDVTRINTATNTPIAGFINAGSGPIGVVATTTRVYVANFGDGTVTVLDAATRTFVDLVVVGSGPFGMALSPDGTRLYVANSGSNTVSAINTATNSVVGTPITMRAEESFT